MKNPPRNIMSVQDKSRIEGFPVKEFSLTRIVNTLLDQLSNFVGFLSTLKISSVFEKIKAIGTTDQLEYYEKTQAEGF